MDQLITLFLKLLCLTSGINHGQNYEDACKYDHFDLFTMQPGEPCDNDSCVYVIEKEDALIIKTLEPRKYKVTLKNHGNYWYSKQEFSMEDDRYHVTKTKMPPTRFDRFIFDNTIYEYEQQLVHENAYNTLMIKTPHVYKELRLETGTELIQDRENILRKINSIIESLEKQVVKELIYDVIRTPKEVEFIYRNTGKRYVRTYPELQIWGGVCGLYWDRDENMEVIWPDY